MKSTIILNIILLSFWAIGIIEGKCNLDISEVIVMSIIVGFLSSIVATIISKKLTKNNRRDSPF